MVDDSLSPDAQAACVAYGIDFGALVAGAAKRLREAFAERQRDGYVTVVPDEDALRTCRIEVILAAGRAGRLEDAFGPIQAASSSVQAAEATGSAPLIETANAHYEQTLADVVEEHNLGPIVEALREQLFTTDIERATT